MVFVITEFTWRARDFVVGSNSEWQPRWGWGSHDSFTDQKGEIQ